MSDKFADVAVGDTVLYRHVEPFGFRPSIQFYLPASVVKVTKARFTVRRSDDGKDATFRKSDGRAVGDSDRQYAYMVGEAMYGRTLTDESASLRAFRENRRAFHNVRTLADFIGATVSPDTPNLDELLELMWKAHDMVKPKDGEA